MNGPLRRVTLVVVVLFSLLFLNLNYVQFIKHDEYKSSDYNRRTTLEEYGRERGAILAGDKVLAQSVEVDDGDLKYQREYPEKDPYAHLTGYKSLVYGTSGVEAQENDIMAGDAPELFADRLREVFTGEQLPGGNVQLSVNPKLQEQAWDTLQSRSSDNPAAAVALDPKTGQILAQVSTPSYDPNPIASHDSNESREAWESYNNDSHPLLDRSTGDTYPPGSTMKVVASAVALEAGLTPDSMVPAGNSYKPPDTDRTVTNSNDQCSESQLPLKEALARSCNTTFAQLCVDDFDGNVDDGTDAFRDMAERFGFERDDYTTPLKVQPSTVGELSSDAFLAQACFGQHDVRTTPMMNALVAATVANDGNQMAPQLIKETQGPDGSTLDTISGSSFAQPVDSGVAADLRTMMEEVVSGSSGTGTDAQISGTTVGGKTGTAQHGEDLPEHGWFMGYAMDDDGEPAVAVSVFLASAGDGGSSEATKIAGDLMKTAIGK